MQQVIFRPLPAAGRTVFRLLCWTCGGAFESVDDWRKFCNPGCFRKPGTPGVQRRNLPLERIQYAEGELTEHALMLLLRKWKRQGRPADSVEHLVPRSRGGNNREGNLAPACRSCNSRKGWVGERTVPAG